MCLRERNPVPVPVQHRLALCERNRGRDETPTSTSIMQASTSSHVLLLAIVAVLALVCNPLLSADAASPAAASAAASTSASTSTLLRRTAVQVKQSAKASHSNCPIKCLNGGMCVDGSCQCKRGFAGMDCSRLGCASNCNQHGYCDLSSTPAQCLCQGGWSGVECEISPEQAKQAAKTAAIKLPGGKDDKKKEQSEQKPATQTPPTNPPTLAASAPANPAAPTQPSSGSGLLMGFGYDSCVPSCVSFQGICHQGQCLCALGFTGPTCADRLCPFGCSGRGKCDRVTGTCECYAPYTGRACEDVSSSLSESLVTRIVDALEDIPGAIPIPEHERRNRQNPYKPGMPETSGFHLIETEGIANNNKNNDKMEMVDAAYEGQE